MGNKTDPFDYLGHPVPLFLGESKKEDSYVSKDGPLSGMDGLRKSLHLGHECNLTKQANSNIQDILALYPGGKFGEQDIYLFSLLSG